MSEVNAPRHGGAPPQSRKLLIREKTWIDMMLAPRPTPQMGRSNGVPSPAAMPATWVPCQQPSGSSGQYTPAPGPICSSAPFEQMVGLRAPGGAELHVALAADR